MKSKLFILMVLFMLVGASNVSAQDPGVLVNMSDSFYLDSSQASDPARRVYKYLVSGVVDFGGLINITERPDDEAISKMRVLLLNEVNFDLFESRESYKAEFQVDIVAANETVFWNATYNANRGEIACFVYWYMEPASNNVGQVKVYIEMWDWDQYQPTFTTITYPTDTTTTTTDTTTTTTDTTSTTTDGVEDNLFVYLLLGALGGIGVIAIYMVVRPKKVKYVWENK